MNHSHKRTQPFPHISICFISLGVDGVRPHVTSQHIHTYARHALFGRKRTCPTRSLTVCVTPIERVSKSLAIRQCTGHGNWWAEQTVRRNGQPRVGVQRPGRRVRGPVQLGDGTREPSGNCGRWRNTASAARGNENTSSFHWLGWDSTASGTCPPGSKTTPGPPLFSWIAMIAVTSPHIVHTRVRHTNATAFYVTFAIHT